MAEDGIKERHSYYDCTLATDYLFFGMFSGLQQCMAQLQGLYDDANPPARETLQLAEPLIWWPESLAPWRHHYRNYDDFCVVVVQRTGEVVGYIRRWVP